MNPFLKYTNVDYLLKNFHNLELTPALYFSALMAVVQLVFIILLCLTLFSLLFIRARLDPVRKRNKELFSNYLLQSLWPDPSRIQSEAPPIAYLAKNTIQETVFKYVITLQGNEKKKAIEIYTKLGLLKHDIRKLKSYYWWNRLEALVNIELIAPSNLQELVRPLVEDDHPLVGLFAVKVLSKFLNEYETLNMVKLLRTWSYPRQDIYQEILDNFSKLYPDAIAGFLELNIEAPSDFDRLCLRSLSKTMFLDVSPTLLKWTAPKIPLLHRIEAIRSLGSLGDERVVPNLLELLKAESDEISGEILLTLEKILGKNSVPIPESLNLHPGPHVKRALRKLKEREP